MVFLGFSEIQKISTVKVWAITPLEGWIVVFVLLAIVAAAVYNIITQHTWTRPSDENAWITALLTVARAVGLLISVLIVFLAAYLFAVVWPASRREATEVNSELTATTAQAGDRLINRWSYADLGRVSAQDVYSTSFSSARTRQFYGRLLMRQGWRRCRPVRIIDEFIDSYVKNETSATLMISSRNRPIHYNLMFDWSAFSPNQC
jgi:hypothetical protein